jgi:hypothetical protein
MTTQEVHRQALQNHIAAFLETQDNTDREEWYTTQRNMAAEYLGRFEQFLFGAEDAKAERRRQYEELKKEFEGEGQ